ncbi:histidine phosphatase family protein [Pseudorhizobium halotolerans]|uniref:Histidine phosphatase family protein n=1 Tax=Pseudorhizobium halotolerans TaxID=1233081 RepID=A0ABM8PCX3_9HYPH|nr:histidine phosphatase family protein [Pseudorhizobium halotolerans]CAD7023342.1 histidine phosphatase family protein [Pseudorhizobium halotolerans]
MADKTDKEAPQGQRRLLLLRHAKSAWPDAVADHERPLAERGEKAAPAMGNYMAREHLIPDLALVSDARRTRQTWELVQRRLPAEVATRIDPTIYEAPAGRLLDTIRALGDSAATLLLIGHNPGLQDLALMLTGDALAAKYPTAALAVIDFPVADWRQVGPGSGLLTRFVTPRSLP